MYRRPSLSTGLLLAVLTIRSLIIVYKICYTRVFVVMGSIKCQNKCPSLFAVMIIKGYSRDVTLTNNEGRLYLKTPLYWKWKCKQNYGSLNRLKFTLDFLFTFHQWFSNLFLRSPFDFSSVGIRCFEFICIRLKMVKLIFFLNFEKLTLLNWLLLIIIYNY